MTSLTRRYSDSTHRTSRMITAAAAAAASDAANATASFHANPNHNNNRSIVVSSIHGYGNQNGLPRKQRRCHRYLNHSGTNYRIRYGYYNHHHHHHRHRYGYRNNNTEDDTGPPNISTNNILRTTLVTRYEERRLIEACAHSCAFAAARSRCRSPAGTKAGKVSHLITILESVKGFEAIVKDPRHIVVKYLIRICTCTSCKRCPFLRFCCRGTNTAFPPRGKSIRNRAVLPLRRRRQ